MLAARLKTARIAKGLTQRELAERVRVDQGYISRIERGQKRPTVELLSALARELGVGIAHLVGEAVAEDSESYPRAPRASEIIFKDYGAPGGLRDFAADRALVAALGVTEDEWQTLASIKLPGEASKDGYVQLLVTVRAVTRPRV